MLPQNLTFGVEIECYANVAHDVIRDKLIAGGMPAEVVWGDIHRTSSKWKVVRDASLRNPPRAGFNGAEIVSPILSGETGLATLTKVLDVLKALGCEVNTSAGIHVHVGARNATVAQHRNICKMFLKYEHVFDTLVSRSRRSNHMCATNLPYVSGSSLADKFATLDSKNTVQTLAAAINGGWEPVQYSQYRYRKFNMQSMATHGTVEFRQHQGSVESVKVVAWVRLVTGFVATAMSVRTVAPVAGTFESLMTKVDRSTAEYLDGRRAVLAR